MVFTKCSVMVFFWSNSLIEPLPGAADPGRHVAAAQAWRAVTRLSEARELRQLLSVSVARQLPQVRLGLGDRSGRLRGVLLRRRLSDQLYAENGPHARLAHVHVHLAVLFAAADEPAAAAVFRQGPAGDTDRYTEHGRRPVLVLVEMGPGWGQDLCWTSDKGKNVCAHIQHKQVDVPKREK